MENRLTLFQRSSHFLWTDEYIAKNMLEAHLDLTNDVASRNEATIDATVEWIHHELNSIENVIDLGCGPGLYAERMAQKGYHMTGLDLSENSLRYARESAIKMNLPIRYLCGSYLDEVSMNDIGRYDAAMCIYCDFGALIPVERDTFLSNVALLLKEEGVLIFDVFSEAMTETRENERDFVIVEGEDFWSETPHIILTESQFFEAEQAWGYRNIIIDTTTGKQKEFITWDLLYTEASITELLAMYGFKVDKIEKGLVAKNTFTSNEVLFVKAVKIS